MDSVEFLPPVGTAYADPRATLPWVKPTEAEINAPVIKSRFLEDMASTFVITMTLIVGKTFMAFQQTKVQNIESFYQNVLGRPKLQERPIITVSNHQATLDDPILFSILMRHRYSTAPYLRWTVGAHELCYPNPFLGLYCRLCKVLPIIRGDGIWQPMLDKSIIQLNGKTDNWVHIFPEGRVNQEDKMLRFKWGVGRLVADSGVTPLVLPIYIEGTREILDETRPHRWLPSFGCNVSVRVGEPLDFTDIVQKAKIEADQPGQKVDRVKTYRLITSKIQEAVEQLQQEERESRKGL